MAVDESLRREVLAAVDRRLTDKGCHASTALLTIRLDVMREVADALQLSFEHCTELCRGGDDPRAQPSCLLLRTDDAEALRTLWKNTVQTPTTIETQTLERFLANERHVTVVNLSLVLGVVARKLTIDGRRDKKQKLFRTRELNELLAVDGFAGFMPGEALRYLKHLRWNGAVVDSPPHRRRHVAAVRATYALFDERDDLSCLTGTDSACCIFLALLRLYLSPAVEDQRIRLVADQVRKNAEGLLQGNTHYYRDLQRIVVSDDEIVGSITNTYLEHLGKEHLDAIAEDKLNELCSTRVK